MSSTLVYKGCGESLRGLDPSKNHHLRYILVYRGYGESLEGVYPSSVPRKRCILV